MISADIFEKYADVLFWGLKISRKNRFKKGDVILVRYDLAAVQAAEAIQAKLLGAGMHPVMRMVGTHIMDRQFFELSNNRQLVFHAPGEKELLSQINGSIYLMAPQSLTHLADIPSARIAKSLVARKPLRAILDKREQEGKFSWTLGIVPTKELANQAQTTLATYTNQWLRACNLDDSDPVKRWKEIHKKAQSVKTWLGSLDVDRFHVLSKNIDLWITPGKQRRWLGISGHNIPSFEIFMSPDFRGTQGVFFADQPSFRSGNYIKGVRLEFSDGKVTRADAEKGQDFLEKQLATDSGASRVGEFSLTDRRFSRINRFMANTLFDENFGGKNGNCHIAIGNAYSDSYNGDTKKLTRAKKRSLGFNDSALHWDLVNTEPKTVTAHLVNGKTITIYENGQFTKAERN